MSEDKQELESKEEVDVQADTFLDGEIEAQIEEMSSQMKEIVFNTMKGDFTFYEDELGLATDPVHGLYKSSVVDPDLEETGLVLDIGNETYLQPITIQSAEGMLVPIPTGDDSWYKWEVWLKEDNMSFEFKKEEYYQAITVLMKYSDLKQTSNPNEA